MNGLIRNFRKNNRDEKGGKPIGLKVRKTLWALIRFIIIFGLAFIILRPIVYKLMVSFMSKDDLINPAVSLIPVHWTLNYWKLAISQLNLEKTFINTFFLSLLVGILQVVTCTMAGYGLGRFRFKGRNIIFIFVILIMLIPASVTSTAQYLRFAFFGVGDVNISLLDTYWPIILLAFTGTNARCGLYIYLMREFFRTMPGNLEEAAFIDGCGFISAFIRVIAPNARGMMTTVFLFSFCWQWTEKRYANMYFSEMPLFGNIFSSFSGGSSMESAIVQNAAALLISLPLLIIFLVFQRTLVKSITLSGLAN